MATALITGATAGIGHEFAAQLAARGNDLVLVARDGVRLEKVATELGTRHGVRVEVLTADLSKQDDITTVARRVESSDRPIDMVVNNAGHGMHTELLDASVREHQWNSMMVMQWALQEISVAAGRAMRERGHGSIINVASTSAWIRTGNYSALKSWVLVFTEGLAGELHGTGVKVTALCPGWVHTEFHERADINNKLPEIVYIDVHQLVREALDDNAHGKVISVPSVKWKVALALAQHAPRWGVRLISRALSKSRRKH